MTPLTSYDFPDFFEEVWGYSPFHWQQELLEYVVGEKRWPDLVDIPTGLGKTATIDIALFALAIETTTEPDRSAWVFPHRIVMVVDRRVIVDQAYERAEAVRVSVESAPKGSIRARVRDALLARAGFGPGNSREQAAPLLSSVLRGGIVRDETWARRPDVAAVIASTVDQVGSRLLFRGYGLSTGARPIHAGLLANDTLFLLDEVHLARPFAETLDAVARLAARSEIEGMSRRLGVVQLSATPAVKVAACFPEQPLTRSSVPPSSLDPRSPEGIAARRTGNSKPADLIEVQVPTDPSKANQKFAKAVAEEIDHRAHGCSRLAVMVNRVDTARRVARILETLASKDDRYEVVLLTGRMRPVDRDRVLDDVIVDRLDPGPRGARERPLVVVATQSLEAGADFDFDVLVTECASIDALRQRFGRVDRDGQRWLNGETARSAVLCRSTDAKPNAVDPVYGPALQATWAWLQTQESVDFGFDAMPNPDGVELFALLPPVDRAPLLAASHLDRWSQTSEREVSAEPEVAQWLHGVESTNDLADVQVIWRDCLDPSLFRWYTQSEPEDIGSLGVYVAEALELTPPLAAEALAVPLQEVRRWLRAGDGDPLLADAPATVDDGGPPARHSRPARLVARWANDGVVVIPPEQIRPGDTVVVPAAFGGIAMANWEPTATQAVHDESRRLAWDVRGTALVVFTEQQCEKIGVPWPDPEELGLLRRVERREHLVDLVMAHRDELQLGDAELRNWHVIPIPTRITDEGEVHRDYLVAARLAQRSGEGDDLATDATDDALSLIGRPARLDRHLRGVGYHAARFATSLGWDEALVRAVRLAGELHDAGKADSRFQFMLAGGLPTDMLLAKSASTAGDRDSRKLTRRLAGYPGGMRHEALSLALIRELDGPDGVDLDLVMHLVATHHGWGRYRFRPVVDRHPEKVALEIETESMGRLRLAAPTDHGLEAIGSGHDERFWELTRRYGWWTLAYLEAILRLADHHRSHLEQNGRVEEGALVEEGEA